MADALEIILSRVHGAARTIASLETRAGEIATIGEALAACLARGGRVYTCGNGGSAAEALHLAEEMIGKYSRPRRPLAGVCLNADPTALTCIANDFGYDEVFARQVEGLTGPDDALVVFSTSGASRNLVRALEAAGRTGCVRIGLLGKTGGACAPLCDHALIVGGEDTGHIQEAHQVALHILLEILEADMRSS